LLLHGWLDNCRSFWKLAPQLHKQGYELLALDLPGHGTSGHRSQDSPNLVLSDYVYYVREVLCQINWKSEVTMIGHSLGASIAIVYAAVFPEQMKNLVLLEGAGPLAKLETGVHKHIRDHIEMRIKGNLSLYSKGRGKARSYPTVEKAAETRQESARRAPGNQYLSIEASRELVARATKNDVGGNGITFQHDPRLLWPSILYMTPSQVESLQRSVQCPTALLLAEDGWPFDEQMLTPTRQRLQPKLFDILPGSHHFHADPNTADSVARSVIKFLAKY